MRINVIPPIYLADQHLVAEYREIKMLPKMFLRSLKSKRGLREYGGEYTLNRGHGKSLYNKFGFIEKRFQQLLEEMHSRNFKTNHDILDLSGIQEEFFGDYMPTEEAIRINIERILLRINDKHEWYLYYGKSVDWSKFYGELKLLKRTTNDKRTICKDSKREGH